ncbi:hypothetical protein CB1_000319013 [Camelus ferus]|nr:hypothetical protein CB1_000319013 [Camelus ferus]
MKPAVSDAAFDSDRAFSQHTQYRLMNWGGPYSRRQRGPHAWTCGGGQHPPGEQGQSAVFQDTPHSTNPTHQREPQQHTDSSLKISVQGALLTFHEPLCHRLALATWCRSSPWARSPLRPLPSGLFAQNPLPSMQTQHLLNIEHSCLRVCVLVQSW